LLLTSACVILDIIKDAADGRAAPPCVISENGDDRVA
jgi:hypothetical protein